MLQKFKEKYKLTLENYLTYKDLLLSKKPCSFAKSKEVIENEMPIVFLGNFAPLSRDFVEELQKTRVDGYTGIAYDFGVRKMFEQDNSQEKILEMVLRPREIAEKFGEIVQKFKQTQDLDGDKARALWTEEKTNLLEYLTENEANSYYGKNFISAFDDYFNTFSADLSLVEKMIIRSEEMLANYQNVIAVNIINDEWENVKTLRKLCDYYNMIIDANTDFNALDDELNELTNKLTEQIKEEEKILQLVNGENGEVIASNIAVQWVRQLQRRYVLRRKSFSDYEKKGIKKYNKLKKLIEKCDKKAIQVPFKKLTKMSPVTLVDDYERLYVDKISAKELIDTVKNYTTKELTYLFKFDEVVRAKTFDYEFIYNEEKNKHLNLIRAKAQTGKTVAQAKLDYINEVFLPFYVFTATPLLDTMVELVYFGTFEEFKELPPVMQNRNSIDTILKYYENKRVTTVKEAINLYFDKVKVDENYQPERCDEEETKQMIANSYASEEYRASLPLKESKIQEINKTLN